MRKEQTFFDRMIEALDDEDTSLAADGSSSGNFGSFIDTGSYSLNALLSASIHGGIADNKVIGLAGIESVGKTYVADSIMGTFLRQFPGAGAVVYDSESTKILADMEHRGFDTKRIVLVEKPTVQKFVNHALKFLQWYATIPLEERPRMIMILDSLGQLSTSKEMEDSLAGIEKRDMTRTQVIKGAFRVMQLALAKFNIPFIVTNHVYDQIGAYVPTKVMSGGSGLKYAATQIVFLTKKKDKVDGEVTGNIIHCTMEKSRISREKRTVDTRIKYDGGLDRYYGLLAIAEKAGIFQKVSTKYRIVGTETTAFGKSIESEPEKYFTADILAKIETFVQKEFAYGFNDDDSFVIKSDDNVMSLAEMAYANTHINRG